VSVFLAAFPQVYTSILSPFCGKQIHKIWSRLGVTEPVDEGVIPPFLTSVKVESGLFSIAMANFEN